MNHFFTRNSLGRVYGFLKVNSVRKKWKIYPNFKIPEIFGFLDLGLSLEPDTWLYLFGHGISKTQPMWGHTQNFSSFGPLILHLPGGAESAPPLTQMWSWDPLTIRVKVWNEVQIFLQMIAYKRCFILHWPLCLGLGLGFGSSTSPSLSSPVIAGPCPQLLQILRSFMFYTQNLVRHHDQDH